MSQGCNGHFELELLSSWNLFCGERRLHLSPREQRLISALAIEGSRPRSYLCGLLWPESGEPKALGSLRVVIHFITRNAPGLLEIRGTLLALSESVSTDLQRLQEEVHVIMAGEKNDLSLSDVNLLRRAELLPGWYEDWILLERARLSHLRLHTLQVMARNSLAKHNYEVALEAAEAALEIEPLFESAIELLILTHLELGNKLCAVRAYKMYESYLKENLGATPSPTIRASISHLL